MPAIAKKKVDKKVAAVQVTATKVKKSKGKTAKELKKLAKQQAKQALEQKVNSKQLLTFSIHRN